MIGQMLGTMALVAMLAACSERSPEAAAPAGEAVPDAAAATPAVVAPPPSAVEPIGFGGYGVAVFGSDEAMLRSAWTGALRGGAGDAAEGASCYYLAADPAPANGRGIAFMFEEGRLVRYDVDTADRIAPGGITVGMKADAVFAAFPGKVQEQPDKYLPGARDLIVADPAGGAARLIVKTGADAIVTSWRIGVPPQVDYVEGCG
jgi:hypothetical protein